MDPASYLLSTWPGVASAAHLIRAGATQPQLERAARQGAIERVRRGWYSIPFAPEPVLRAVRAGGALTGVSAARLYGLWIPPDDRLHVSVARNSPGPTRSNLSRDVCVHWRREPTPTVRAIEPLIETVVHGLGCLPEEMGVVLIDSALNKRAVSLLELERRFATLPHRYRRALNKADAQSDSGIETLVRLRLRARGMKVRTQVSIPRVGRVDLVVGDRLVIQTDGRDTHDTAQGFITDRERDLQLFAAGYERLRLTYSHVMFRWSEVEPVIRDKVRRREHLRNPSGRPSRLMPR